MSILETTDSNATWLGKWDPSFVGQWIDAVFMLVSRFTFT